MDSSLTCRECEMIVRYYACAFSSGPSVVAGDSGGLAFGGRPRLRGTGLATLSVMDPPSSGISSVSSGA